MSAPAPNTQYRLSDVLVLFKDSDRYEPLTAKEIAEDLGCSRRTALNKLDNLQKRGEVDSKKVGARGRVWWRPAAARRNNEPMSPTEVEQRVLRIELPGSGHTLRKRQEAVQEAYEYLRRRRVAGASEISATIYTVNDGEYRNKEILWSKTLLPGLKQLPGLDVPEPGGKWHFVGGAPDEPVHTVYDSSDRWWVNKVGDYEMSRHEQRDDAIIEGIEIAKSREGTCKVYDEDETLAEVIHTEDGRIVNSYPVDPHGHDE